MSHLWFKRLFDQLALRCSGSDWGQTLRLWQWGQLCPCWISSIDEHDEAVKLWWFSGTGLKVHFFLSLHDLWWLGYFGRKNFNLPSTPIFFVSGWCTSGELRRMWMTSVFVAQCERGCILDPEKFQPFLNISDFSRTKKNPEPVRSVSWGLLFS